MVEAGQFPVEAKESSPREQVEDQNHGSKSGRQQYKVEADHFAGQHFEETWGYPLRGREEDQVPGNQHHRVEAGHYSGKHFEEAYM